MSSHPHTLESTLMIVTTALYGMATLFYWSVLVRNNKRLSKPILAITILAALVHAQLLLRHGFARGFGAFDDIYHSLLIASWFCIVIFLLSCFRYRSAFILGAFVVPLSLLLLLSALPGTDARIATEGLRSTLLPFHIGVNILGTALFALAFAAALAYLIQAAALKHKRVGALSHQLPALELLDKVALQSSLAGFVLHTVGLSLGALIVIRERMPALTVTQLFGVLTWVCFATVLGLRYGAGWQGRRAAYGTVGGFLLVLLVLTGYLFGW